jgi:hypothetical protein
LEPLIYVGTEGGMTWRLREDGKRATVDLGEGTEARHELDALVDTAGLQNIIIALARFTSDRCEALEPQDPAVAACWLQSSRALFRCFGKLDSLWPPREEMRASVRRSENAERLGAKLGQTVKKWLR